jgi:SAM-dependent methyltransferase
MRESTIQWYECPECKSDNLTLKKIKTVNNNIEQGIISCNKCDALYPIFNYVPILIINKKIHSFLPKEIIAFLQKQNIAFPAIKKINNSDRIVIKSSKYWGYQWDNLNANILDRDYFFTEESFNNFIPIKKEEYADKDVLAVGAGYGKEVAHLKNYNCANVFTLDVSPYIFNTALKYKKNDKLHFVMADIMDLPFNLKFDIVIADHVLQHIPDISGGVAGLLKKTKTSGIFSASVYSYENNFLWRNIITPMKKIFLSHLPISILYYLSLVPALLVYIIIKLYMVILRLSPKIFNLLPLHELVSYWNKFSFLCLWRYTIFDILQSPTEKFSSKSELLNMFPKDGNLSLKLHAQTMWVIRYDK